MTRLTSAGIAALVVSALAASATGQTVYPTGTTIYDPERSWKLDAAFLPAILAGGIPGGMDETNGSRSW